VKLAPPSVLIHSLPQVLSVAFLASGLPQGTLAMACVQASSKVVELWLNYSVLDGGALAEAPENASTTHLVAEGRVLVNVCECQA
jgi:hypothetical protein